ncbi:hypothetical protein SS37A_42490 (plasmid) [Methylocystis iwaonis]|uniref:Metallo-beta-lactamase domain-containing protein n=2 Tax=Methylocystis iwaonis TaxID=2885079 RepID=A0ABM8EF85_9HYPH|nr:hypothetical protein SS37A_42490 [Methylocystis iwaonis]
MTLRIVVHDVGHGQAIHAFTPDGNVIVIDLGCSADFSPLGWLKGQTKTIDSLVITHPHGDHIDEMLLLKKHGFAVRQLWRPNWLDKKTVYEQNQSTYQGKLDAYFEMSDRYNGAIAPEELVGNPEATGGVSIRKFASRDCGQSNINNHSGVVVFTYHGITVVIPGDNEPASWKALLKQPDFAKVLSEMDVFMASHHGRESGYCADIFDNKPNLCIVSDGSVKDTDAAGRYSYHAKGWSVSKRKDQTRSERFCVTTRSDGHIELQIGRNPNGNRFLAASVA